MSKSIRSVRAVILLCAVFSAAWLVRSYFYPASIEDAKPNFYKEIPSRLAARLDPGRIFLDLQSGRVTIGVYKYGMRCRCGFVLWSEKDESRIRIHYLQVDVGGDNDTIEYPRTAQSMPEDEYPYPEPPVWVTPSESGEATLFVIYKDRKIVFVGANGNDESFGDLNPSFPDEETRNEAIHKMIADQFKNMYIYKAVARW